MKKTRKSSKNNSFFFLILACVVFFGIFVVRQDGKLFKTEKVGVETELEASCQTQDFSGKLDPSEVTAYFEGEEISVAAGSGNSTKRQVLGTTNGEKWIEIDLSEQKLRAWEGDTLYLETSISTGLPGTPTPKGEFRIWTKLRATKMEGGEGKSYYRLPNVPFVMFFEGNGVPAWKGYGLHGTYWHNDFGNRRSHGCVNLPTPIAEKIYYWAAPNMPEGKNTVRSTDENPGTKIVIHE